MKLAQAGYFTIAFDLPGHGFSSDFNLPSLPPPAPPIPALTQFDADVVLEATTFLIQNRKFTLLGNSFGGFIAQIIGIQNSSRLENLILLDTSPKFSPDATGFWMPPKYTADPSIVPIFFALVLGDEAIRRAILEASVASSFPYALFSPKQQQTYIRQYLEQLAQLNQSIGVVEIFSLAVGDLRDLVSQISARTLVINGGVLRVENGLIVGDSITPWGASQFLNENIVGSQLVIFNNSDHTPQITNYPQLSKEILTWLPEAPIKPCIPLKGVHVKEHKDCPESFTIKIVLP